MSNMPIALMDDNPPYLDFEVSAIEDRANSIKEGRKIYNDVEVVLITPMGDNKTQVIKYVHEWISHLKERLHHNMITRKYFDFCLESYDAWKNKRSSPVTGTPIEQWPQLSPSEVKIILNANYRTVEDLALANDEGLGLIGMGARNLKLKAEIWLQSAQDHGAVSERVNALETKLETSKHESSQMLRKIAELEQDLESNKIKKRGRPKKLKDAD